MASLPAKLSPGPGNANLIAPFLPSLLWRHSNTALLLPLLLPLSSPPKSSRLESSQLPTRSPELRVRPAHPKHTAHLPWLSPKQTASNLLLHFSHRFLDISVMHHAATHSSLFDPYDPAAESRLTQHYTNDPRVASLSRLSRNPAGEPLDRPAAKLEYELEQRRAQRHEDDAVRRRVHLLENAFEVAEHDSKAQALVEKAQAEIARRQRDPKWQQILPVAVGGSPVKQQEQSPAVARASTAPPIPSPFLQRPSAVDERADYISPAYLHTDTAFGARPAGFYNPAATPIEHAADMYRGLHRGAIPFGYGPAGMAPAGWAMNRGAFYY